MDNLPSIPALLALARDVLVNELMPLLPEERHGDALLVAETLAIAGRQIEAEEEPMGAVLRELETLYGLVSPPPPQPSPACGGGKGGGNAEASLLRRLANDLRIGAFEVSEARDRAARAILWRLTITRLRRTNPQFLVANGINWPEASWGV